MGDQTNVKATWGVIEMMIGQHKGKNSPTHMVKTDGSVTGNIKEPILLYYLMIFF